VLSHAWRVNPRLRAAKPAFAGWILGPQGTLCVQTWRDVTAWYARTLARAIVFLRCNSSPRDRPGHSGPAGLEKSDFREDCVLPGPPVPWLGFQRGLWLPWSSCAVQWISGRTVSSLALLFLGVDFSEGTVLPGPRVPCSGFQAGLSPPWPSCAVQWISARAQSSLALLFPRFKTGAAARGTARRRSGPPPPPARRRTRSRPA
jgi:hypothetical protein